MMEERKPEWYDLARRGPRRQSGFTPEQAQQVMRRIQTMPEGDVSSWRQADFGRVPSSHRRRHRMGVIAVAVIAILLVAGAGLLKLRDKDAGVQGNAGPSPTAVVQSAVTEEMMKQTAEQAMLAQIGKKLPFSKLDRAGYGGMIRLDYQEAEDTASFWISEESGELAMFIIDAALPAQKAAESPLVGAARNKLKEFGYHGDFSLKNMRRTASYGRTSDRKVHVQDVVTAQNAYVTYADNEYVQLGFEIAPAEISPELLQRGQTALERVGGAAGKQLIGASKTARDGRGQLVLKYGETEYTLASVVFDDASGKLIAVSDASQGVKANDPAKRAEQDKALLKMDPAKLQSAAAEIADDLFGISLKDYILVKNEPTPGIISFERSNEDAPDIQAAYNLDGKFYSFARLVDPDMYVDPVPVQP
ncbi:hypothetical protein [Paenibacillus sp. NFR01]|uniref:hypothetical protein n=1 Tax=Paenibacillus sp. NFR01 TaxID=1566279 RepID=UPI0008CB04C8|nr:hypothetical protein [Paenibacillus sp. NFR01]SEU18703.1 hypothetical protein SAMN03159358_3819 [Paenibacillus sp. NFR01]